jgi:holo-[acyl-carrier protein] synthase
MILGVGVDIVDLQRFARSLERTPKLLDRLFTPGERDHPAASLAGRFAAKEALIKAFGGSGEMTWHHMEIVTNTLGAPSFLLTGPANAMAVARGITSVHVSISHDANAAVAFVVAEGIATPVGVEL